MLLATALSFELRDCSGQCLNMVQQCKLSKNMHLKFRRQFDAQQWCRRVGAHRTSRDVVDTSTQLKTTASLLAAKSARPAPRAVAAPRWPQTKANIAARRCATAIGGSKAFVSRSTSAARTQHATRAALARGFSNSHALPIAVNSTSVIVGCKRRAASRSDKQPSSLLGLQLLLCCFQSARSRVYLCDRRCRATRQSQKTTTQSTINDTTIAAIEHVSICAYVIH